MYSIYKNVLTNQLCDEIVNSIGQKYLKGEKRHFESNGKNFFNTATGFLLLKKILKELNFKTDIINFYNNPNIDHAYLLLKPPGGNKTPPHQDRPFWEKKEPKISSMITCWIALQDIDEKNGCLELGDNLSSNLCDFNKNQKLYEHKILGSKSGNFNYILNDKKFDSKKLKPLSIRKGDLIAFDSFEVHSSTENLSSSHRLSLKIVFREDYGIYKLDEIYNFGFNFSSLKLILRNSILKNLF